MTRLYDRAAVIPGRSLTRSKKAFAPRFAEWGQGALVRDTDGATYIDLCCALGAISLGYGRTPSFDDVQGVFSLPHRVEVEAAEAVLRHVAPWASHVRFMKTGSEATHAAYRIAKAVTGRHWVNLGDWAYHGWHEWCSSNEGAFQIGHGEDPEATIWRSDVAAVFIEPHRWAPVDVAWLRAVRAWCDRVGALLVFDEMIYGGRWALGGATEYFGVQPDLACYGKAFGNGAAVAFVVGRDALAAHGELASGTYSGEAGGLEAVVEVLDVYRTEDVIATLWARGRQLADGLDQVLARAPALPAVREGAPVHQRVRFADPALGPAFAAEMMARGVLWHPDVVNVCAAHTVAQIDQVLAAADASAQALLARGI